MQSWSFSVTDIRRSESEPELRLTATDSDLGVSGLDKVISLLLAT